MEKRTALTEGKRSLSRRDVILIPGSAPRASCWQECLCGTARGGDAGASQ